MGRALGKFQIVLACVGSWRAMAPRLAVALRLAAAERRIRFGIARIVAPKVTAQKTVSTENTNRTC